MVQFPAASTVVSSVHQWRVGGTRKLYPRQFRCGCDRSFHRAIYPVMVLAQFFGVLPVSNIGSKCPLSLEFRRKSSRFVFAVLLLTCCGLVSELTTFWVLESGMNFNQFVSFVFVVANLLMSFSFLRLAKDWPQIMQIWHSIEKRLPQLDTGIKQKVFRKIRLLGLIFILTATIEHILGLNVVFIDLIFCPGVGDIFKAYYYANSPHIAYFIQYSFLFGVFVKYLNVTLTFVWCFSDLFIMFISIGLSGLFKQLNEVMLRDKGKV